MTTPTNPGAAAIPIHRGAIFWREPDASRGSIPGHAHPHVVIQVDVAGDAHQVLVCALTSNLQRASEPGNVLLDLGEGNLSRRSVAIVSQIAAVDRTQLGEYIGTLSESRVEQIWAGRRFQQAAFFGER